jgi:transcriptional regulator with XRE-family HTH domain
MLAVPLSTRKVPPALSLVNSLVPVTTRGERLRAYLLAKTGGRPGWQSELVTQSGVKRQTISKWTNPKFDRYPDLETLAAIAGALGVQTFEVIAAMDGDVAVSLSDPAVRETLRSEIEAILDERLGPRQAPPGRGSAA